MQQILFFFISAVALTYGIKSYNRKHSCNALFTLIFFFTEGFNVAPQPGGTLSYGNAGLVFLIYLLVVTYNRHQIYFKSFLIEKQFTRFGWYFACCILFSLLYYKFEPFEILRVVKWIIPFWSVYLFRLLSERDFECLMNRLIKITVLLNVFYIIQAFGLFSIFNNAHASGMLDSGITRFYNKPTFSTFFLFYMIYNKGKYEKVFFRLSAIILASALLLSFNRMEIAGAVIGYCVCMFLQSGNIQRKIVQAATIALFTIPVMIVLQARDMSSNSSSGKNDIQTILNGGYKEFASNGSSDGGTMTFRIAMLYERIDYMINECNIFEGLFGLGLGHSDYEKVYKKYNFSIGTLMAPEYRRQGFNVSQLSSADFAWVGMLCQWGSLGCVLFMAIYWKMFKFFFHNKKDAWALVSIGYLAYLFIWSFAGSTFSEANYYLLPFMVAYHLYSKKKNPPRQATTINTRIDCNESNTYRVRFR